MKLKNIALLFLAMLAVVFMGTTVANATNQPQRQKGDGNRSVLTDEQKAAMDARREEIQTKTEAIQTAIENDDYEAWKSLEEEMQAKRVNILDIVNADNFDKFVEMHQLMESKDFEGAKVIAEELGLNNAHGMGIGMGMMDHGMGHGRGMHSFLDQMILLLPKNNYNQS